MPPFAAVFRIALLLLPQGGVPEHPAEPQHYIFFNRSRERIQDSSFLAGRRIAGAQLKYTWRELEPRKDEYNVRVVLDDLAALERAGKKLFLQIQDVSFGLDVHPDYLREDPALGGGVAAQHAVRGDDGAMRVTSWIARRWNPRVRERWTKLLQVLGDSLDGRVEGIVLAETSVDFVNVPVPPDFSPEQYLHAVKKIMTAARSAFRKSHVILYANFMPGEWLPDRDRGYLRAVYEHANDIGMGVGGPDLLPHRRGQRNHSYPLIARRPSHVVAGSAVQDGNLAEINPATGARVTARELLAFGRDTLRLSYIFWGTEEPYYSEQVLPILR